MEIRISKYAITLHRIYRDTDNGSCIRHVISDFEDLEGTEDYPFSREVIDRAVDSLYESVTAEGYKGYIVVEDTLHGRRIYLREH